MSAAYPKLEDLPTATSVKSIIKDVMDLSFEELLKMNPHLIVTIYSAGFHNEVDFNSLARRLDNSTSNDTKWYIVDSLIPSQTVTHSGICDSAQGSMGRSKEMF
jgi:hypothetical protein